MTFVGIIFAALGLLTLSWGMVERTNKKLGLLILVYLLHLAATVAYYWYVQTADADTKLYYYDPYGFYGKHFSLGTMFVIYAVQWLKGVIGGSYLDFFMLFQLFGLAGLMLLIRTLEELTIALKWTWPALFTVMIFMPGIYFWTSAIGKDAPLFLASTLTVWAMLQFSRRWIWFAVALALMLLFRPHVAVVAVGALAMALVLGRGISPAIRAAAIVFALIGVFFVGRTVQGSLQIDLSSVGSIATYVENQTTVASTAAGNEDVVALSFPLKLISLLFRPLFFDAGGVFGIIASVQNLFMLFAAFLLVRQARVWRAMFGSSLAIRYATFYLLGMILLLTLMYYNVGLGLRQREMFTPPLYLIFGALFCHWRYTNPARRGAIPASGPAANSAVPASART